MTGGLVKGFLAIRSGGIMVGYAITWHYAAPLHFFTQMNVAVLQ